MASDERRPRQLTRSLNRLLLKYTSRDEVTLLDRGTGGVPDVRAAVESYEEKSPLYGFLQYRRRKIVLKYVPEGMSRLVQGRLCPLLYIAIPAIADTLPVHSPHNGPISVNPRQVLPAGYYLRIQSARRSDGKCTVIGLSITRSIRINNVVFELATPPTVDGNR